MTESQDSKDWLNSPILLVPASLTIESLSSPYILDPHGDEIIINPTLAYKLENDFGIVLPKYNEGDDLKEVLSEIARLTKVHKWEIINEVSLSHLSFQNINMYNDLNKHKEEIALNPTIRTISGDASTSNKLPDDITDFDYDKKIAPSEMFQIVDADSSQQDAILCAKKGVSFVLQGPPQ